jgi:putative SOS response-associated peptidase YedK
MCGRLSIAVSKQDLTKYLKENFDIEVIPEEIELPKFNVAPSEDLVSLVSDGVKYRIGLIKWGFKTFEEGNVLINARSETVESLKTFKKSFMERRCIILTDGFFEWERSTSVKTPYRFVLKNRKVFGFAGLWTMFIDKAGNKQYTATILTTKANNLMASIHDRMPVILDEDKMKIWLDPKIRNSEILKRVLVPYREDEMDLYEVSVKVNSPKNKDEEVIKPIKKSI